MNIRYYVINLDTSEKRLSEISSQCAQQNIKFERVSAVDGLTLDLDTVADDIACRDKLGRSIQHGEVGCFLSHKKALEAFILSKAEFAVILEDAAVLTNQFTKSIEDLCNILVMNQDLGFSAINLGPSDYKYTTQLTKYSETELLRAHRFPMRTTGILWARQGAKEILNDNGKIQYPYDDYLRLKLTRNHAGLSVRPPLVSRAKIMSDIGVRSIAAGRTRQNRSRLYFYKKQKRTFLDKMTAIISMVNEKCYRPIINLTPTQLS